MKSFCLAAGIAALLAGPALADEAMMTATPELAPELAMPESGAAAAVLPHSSITETQPLAMPESKTGAAAPFKRCGGETVYLTN